MITGTARLLHLFALFLLPGPCALAQTVSGERIDTLYAGRYGTIGDARLVVRDSVEFAHVWQKAHARLLDKAPRSPQIDFSTTIVIVVGLGGPHNSDSQIGVASASVRSAVLNVSVLIETVEGDCMSFPVSEQPAMIVSVHRTPSVVAFADRVRRTGCNDDIVHTKPRI